MKVSSKLILVCIIGGLFGAGIYAHAISADDWEFVAEGDPF